MLYSPVFKKESGKEYQDKLNLEFTDQMDRRLASVYYEADDWCYRTFGKRVIITCINRTKEENKQGNGSEWSGHLFGRAMDWRTFHLSDNEVAELQVHLRLVWGVFIYTQYHDSGTGKHLHVGIPYKYRRSVFD